MRAGRNLFRKMNISQVIFWTIISAAFIGPGTVTTALRSGSLFQTRLLWTVLFSILACYVLQEASSRITIATGRSIGHVISKRYRQYKYFNINHLLTYLIIFGCAAYQAGNLVGAMEGIKLSFDIERSVLLMIICLSAGFVLWGGRISTISRILSVFVLLMAVIFILLAFQIETSIITITGHTFIPRMPVNSSLYIIGLVGTTIVPYNIFMGSGMSHNKNLSETRFGLSIAIIIGGLITFLILLSGILIHTEFTFGNIALVLKEKLGHWGTLGFSAGLFAAGFTSSITAPLAAAITGQSLYQEKMISASKKKLYFRISWIFVIITGMVFGLLNYKPVPLIITAQAINGLILPFLGVSLFLIINDRSLIPVKYLNSASYNLLMILVIGVTVFLGFFHLISVMSRLFNRSTEVSVDLTLSGILTVSVLAGVIWYNLKRNF